MEQLIVELLIGISLICSLRLVKQPRKRKEALLFLLMNYNTSKNEN